MLQVYSEPQTREQISWAPDLMHAGKGVLGQGFV